MMMKTRHHQGVRRQGFTLVELMCVIAIISMLASVALPAMAKYIRTARSSEASIMLRTIYDAEVAHYFRISSGKGTRATGSEIFTWSSCADNYTTGPLCYAFTYSHIGDTGIGIPPRATKKVLTYQYPAPGSAFDVSPYDWYKSFNAIGVNFDSPVAFAYSVYNGEPSLASLCYRASDYQHWTFRVQAVGDLDGDSTYSTFMRVGYVNPSGDVQGGGAIYSINPLE